MLVKQFYSIINFVGEWRELNFTLFQNPLLRINNIVLSYITFILTHLNNRFLRYSAIDFEKLYPIANVLRKVAKHHDPNNK